MSHTRYAIYYVPPTGPLADFGAAWLGWDSLTGREVPQFDIPGLHEITTAPRKYGFHGTLKPPFRLTDGQTLGALENTAAALAQTLAPAVCDGLTLTRLGRFLALTPHGDVTGLQRVAGACVRELDVFRIPPTEAELAKRRKARLSARQDAYLSQWGYPYVFEEFRFHLTLTGKLPNHEVQLWMDQCLAHLPALPAPFILDQIALCGERPDGRFDLIHRYALTGQA